MANIIRNFWNKLSAHNRSVTIAPTNSIGLPYGNVSTPLSVQSALQLSTVYRCVEVISDAIASQPFDIMEYKARDGWSINENHPIGYMLNFNPNPSMSRFTMMKTLISKVLLEGNGYLHITRSGLGDPIKIDLITEPVKVFLRGDGSLYYVIGREGAEYTVDGEDIIHILNFTYDGLIGISTLSHAALSMGLSSAAESSAKGFFATGANMSGIVSSASKLTKTQADAIKASWAASFNPTTGNPGGIAVMEGGLTFSPVTVNPRDAQMLETRKFNAVDICRFFGVSPSKVFDNENLTYSNIESFQLGFLTDTVSPWDTKIEAEFNRRLLRPSKRITTRFNMNINELLRANLDAKSNYLTKMFQCGGLTINEVRKELGMPRYNHDNADKPMVQINMQTADSFTNKVKPAEAPIDNKVKTNK
jgi:HK97 family phage portal protein